MSDLISQLLAVESNLVFLEGQYNNLEQNVLEIFRKEDEELQKGYDLLRKIDKERLSEQDRLAVYNIEKHLFEKGTMLNVVRNVYKKKD